MNKKLKIDYEKDFETMRMEHQIEREVIKRIINGKAEDKSKIEVLKDLFPEIIIELE